ncbi:MAG TPA: peroxiredoxin [Bacteroidales bacterium]|nr:peroxiredoxin [Bacteroidales bacterium]
MLFHFIEVFMNAVKVGEKVPNFQLVDQNGNMFYLESVLGKNNLIIYFYPKDFTPGCTAEACAFQNMHNDFKDLDAEIIGISSDSVETHLKFAKKYNLTFTLLSDEDNKVKMKFGIVDSFFGLISSRITFVVDKKGIIRNVFNSQINIKKHIRSALDALNTLS